MGQLALGTYWFNRQKKREEKKKKAVPIIFCFHYLDRKRLLGGMQWILIFEAQSAKFVSILSRKQRKVLLAFHLIKQDQVKFNEGKSSSSLLRSQPSKFFLPQLHMCKRRKIMVFLYH